MNIKYKYALFLILLWGISLSSFTQGNEKKTVNPYTFVKSDNKYIVNVNDNSDLITVLSQFCIDQKIKSGTLSGIGMAKEATLRYINPDDKKYTDKSIYEQIAIGNLTGSISECNGKIYLHIHATVNRGDYKVEAGHLVSAIVNGTVECTIEELDITLDRRFCPDKGVDISSSK